MLPHTAISTLTYHNISPASTNLQPPELNPKTNMARKRDIKGVEAVGSKTVGTKRGAMDDEVKPVRKRRRIQAAATTKTKDQPKEDQVKRAREDQVFRFMDLPGETRNQIYEYAVEYAYRCFPPVLPKDKAKRRSNHSASATPTASEEKPNPPLLPFIGLTQACSLLRSEFRPVWLSTNKIPLCALDGYLKTFYPDFKSRISSGTRKRLESQFSPKGSLRLWIRKSELRRFDITRLIKHTVRFPEFKITVHGLPDVQVSILDSLQAFVANKTERWINGIRSRKISVVYLDDRRYLGFTHPGIRILVKDEHASSWMRRSYPLHDKMPGDYLESLGLKDVDSVWNVSFGVDYF